MGKEKCIELLEKIWKKSLSPWNRERFLKHKRTGLQQIKNFIHQE